MTSTVRAEGRGPAPSLTQGVLHQALPGVKHLFRAGVAGSAIQPRIVPIKTRVISGNGLQATNFSLWVGTNCYVAPPRPGGGSSGYHLVTRSRPTLQLVSNASYSTSDSGLTSFILSIEAMSPTNLVVLSLMNPSQLSDAEVTGLYAILSPISLGWTLLNLFDHTDGDMATVYSLIGNLGLNPSEGFEVSNLANLRFPVGSKPCSPSTSTATICPFSRLSLQTTAGPRRIRY